MSSNLLKTNPDEPFAFSFPDLKGNMANTDAKFRDKVVIVNITGSWRGRWISKMPTN
jgi:hypothetical protein